MHPLANIQYLEKCAKDIYPWHILNTWKKMCKIRDTWKTTACMLIISKMLQEQHGVGLEDRFETVLEASGWVMIEKLERKMTSSMVMVMEKQR